MDYRTAFVIDIIKRKTPPDFYAATPSFNKEEPSTHDKIKVLNNKKAS
jgi:hypothetical protein